MYRRRAHGKRRTAEFGGPSDGNTGWYGPRIGKFWRRQLHKAERALVKGYGRERSVAHLASEVSWKAS